MRLAFSFLLLNTWLNMHGLHILRDFSNQLVLAVDLLMYEKPLVPDAERDSQLAPVVLKQTDLKAILVWICGVIRNTS